MQLAIEQAQRAGAIGEVPIGAVLVQNGKVIATGHNRRESDHDPLGHAEIAAIAEGAKALQAWRLTDTTLYVTLEPCLMCAGAIYQARIPRVIFGALDPKAGAMGSLYRVHEDSRLNHKVMVESGILETSCAELLRAFFRAKRAEPS